MATDQAYITETIAQIAALEAKAVAQAILEERGDGDELTSHRSEEVGVSTQARWTFTSIQLHK